MIMHVFKSVTNQGRQVSTIPHGSAMSKFLNCICRYSWMFASMLLVSVVTVSCSLNVPPPDQYSDPDAVKDVSSARAFLASCYISFPHYDYDLSVMGNDFCPTSLAGKDVNELNVYNWSNKDLTTLATGMWQDYYTCISNCDVLLDRQGMIVTATPDEVKKKNAVLAEVKTLKAMCYFDLLRLFATRYDDNSSADGVVIKNEFGFEVNKRSSKQETVAYIEKLLAQALTTDNYPSANGWLSRYAVQYMLAEVNLYKGDYEATALYADSLIDVCQDDMLGPTAYQRLWKNDSFDGRIFAFNTKSSFYTSIQYDEKEGDYYALSPQIVFSATDCRRQSSVYTMQMKGLERRLLGKYNMMNKQGLQPAYINRMRYAGAYYMAAEAYARLGNTEKALSRINHYLRLVGADELSSSLIGDDLISAILHEKAKEYVGEGCNWFMLKRTRQSLPRFTTWGIATSSIINATDYRWTLPLPMSEYKYNDKVRQNQGW